MTNADIAQVCHEANRAYCSVTGDDSQFEWRKAPKWQQTSAVNGVAAARTGMTSEQLHQSWTDEKVNDGWVWGAVKGHPCLVPYDQLPEEQQKKDALFNAVVKALI